MQDKKQFLALIHSNIIKYGYHITIVNSSTEPRYAYTIGLRNLLGFELIFAGGIYYLKDDLYAIFNSMIKSLDKGSNLREQKLVNSLGDFSLKKVDPSWTKLMILGAFDFYKINNIEAFQIIPDKNHYTLDVPDMSKKWNPLTEPVWKWLNCEWDLPVPNTSTAITNLKALYGEAVTEVMRWEEDEWEMFSGPGPDVPKEDIRIVSLTTLLGIDESLHPVLKLNIGKGLWRESVHSQWNQWG